jgi:hypothetical protein
MALLCGSERVRCGSERVRCGSERVRCGKASLFVGGHGSFPDGTHLRHRPLPPSRTLTLLTQYNLTSQ